MTDFYFDSESHEYFFRGKAIPSVTQVLQGEGVIDTTWFSEEGANRGTAIHRLTETYDNDLPCDVEDLKKYKPYLDAYISFVEESGFRVLCCEQSVCSAKLQYAGTLDRLGIINGTWSVLDIKTGSYQKWWGLQTSAYLYALLESLNMSFMSSLEVDFSGLIKEIGLVKRFSLELRKNGTYGLREHSYEDDFREFFFHLKNYQKKLKMGVKLK